MKKLICYGIIMSVLASIATTCLALSKDFPSNFYSSRNLPKISRTCIPTSWDQGIAGFRAACTVTSDCVKKYNSAVIENHFYEALEYGNDAGVALDLGLSALALNDMDATFTEKWHEKTAPLYHEFFNSSSTGALSHFDSPQSKFIRGCASCKVNVDEISRNICYINDLLGNLDEVVKELDEHLESYTEQ